MDCAGSSNEFGSIQAIYIEFDWARLYLIPIDSIKIICLDLISLHLKSNSNWSDSIRFDWIENWMMTMMIGRCPPPRRIWFHLLDWYILDWDLFDWDCIVHHLTVCDIGDNSRGRARTTACAWTVSTRTSATAPTRASRETIARSTWTTARARRAPTAPSALTSSKTTSAPASPATMAKTAKMTSMNAMYGPSQTSSSTSIILPWYHLPSIILLWYHHNTAVILSKCYQDTTKILPRY